MKALWFLVILVIFSLGFLGGTLTYMHLGPNVSHIAPTYALDSCTVDASNYGALTLDSCSAADCFPSMAGFVDFWQEATKNTTFTIDGKPVEITDVQVFYKYYGYDEYRGSPITCPPPRLFYGNITYYPSGIENSQTYVAPTPTITPTLMLSECYCGVSFDSDAHYYTCCLVDGNWDCKPIPSPSPIPTPCAWPIERTAYSFCGKVTVNSSAEFDRLLKAIEKHSYHIKMGWMHLDYEYAHKTYDNTFPSPVNICMGIIPGDNFPIGSEWEGRMAYVIDECASLGSCDFDKLALIPTPTPVFAFPYEFCGNGCLICTDHLGNCTYLSGRPKPTPTSTP